MIYFFRHQVAGVLHKYPFTCHPTPEQAAPIRALMEAEHGRFSKKRPDEELWLIVVQHESFGPGEIPVVKMPGVAEVEAAGARAETPQFSISAVGTVQNP